MKKQLIGSALVIAAIAASAFTVNQEEKSYSYKTKLSEWGQTFNTLDSATKYIGVKSIGFEEAVALKQQLQTIKQEMYTQLKPQIDADSNYYKQQQKEQQQAAPKTPATDTPKK